MTRKMGEFNVHLNGQSDEDKRKGQKKLEWRIIEIWISVWFGLSVANKRLARELTN